MDSRKVLTLPFTRVYIVNQSEPEPEDTSLQLISQEPINLVCRTCLSNNSNLQSIFDNNFNQMIMDCTSVQISEGDGLPSQICSECIDQINQVYMFKLQVQNTDSTLRGLYFETETVENLKETINNCLDDDSNELLKVHSITDCDMDGIKTEIKQEIEVDSSTVSEENDNFKCEENSKGDKRYECDFCQKKFIHSHSLATHRRIHTGEKPYVCTVCGHSSAIRSSLAIHMRIHTKEKPYTCTTCSKVFASASGLADHKLKHTGQRNHICSTCGKGSRTASDLKVHMRTHTGEKPYKCKVPNCTKSFKTCTHLLVHVRIHTGEKPHICKTCSKAFTTSTELKRHSNVHTGNRPYLCNVCGCSFTQIGSLMTHMKIHKRVFSDKLVKQSS
ncbi:hypothetical protein FQA39_LY02753 [Lamprigera yunnana]|nr:hypothetical protein FQA39_LY02753 [Lamprigera yunnana]